MKVQRPIKIIASGSYLPAAVSSEELEEKHDLLSGWSKNFSGVNNRHHVTFETNGYMAKMAIEEALTKAKMSLSEIDLIISASATYDYPLPSQSSIIKSLLDGGLELNTATLDVDTTCLSFVNAFDIASRYLDGDQYKNIIIVSSEIASKGLHSKRPEMLTLFGDAAAAVIVSYDETGKSGVIKSSFRTYSQGVEHTMIRGGGNVNFFREVAYSEDLHSFDMNGIQLLKLTKKEVPGFMDEFFNDLEIGFTNVDAIIPHQASKTGTDLVKSLFDFKEGCYKTNLEQYGNCIAASIPLLLHELIEIGALERGQTCFLVGTSAGFSIGGTLIRY